jgi:putative transposase
MALKATRTIKQALTYKPQHAVWFAQTQALYNRVIAFYFEVIQAHQLVLELSNMEALAALEKLTHATKDHPNPVMPLSEVARDIPAIFRRAAINAALGQAKSFYTSLAKWRKRKEQAQARGKKFSIRPPVPPRRWNRSVILYAGMWKSREGSPLMLKLWTGTSWAWVKIDTYGRDLPDGWEANSPQLVNHGSHWHLHIPIEREIARPHKVETQMTTIPGTKICAVDLNINEHLAACTIQTVEGTVIATRFIRGGKQLHGLRKRQLGRIARKRNKTGILTKGEQDNVHLWAKIRALDEDTAHQVSHRIVEFAKTHGATILVFEHLARFKPEKGKYSKRGNEKRSYWLRGKIFKYAKYKAYNEGIVTTRINPRNTSRECARCGALVARYNAGQEAVGYTPGASLVFCGICQMRGNGDRNASIVVGKRLLARYPKREEKPQAPLQAERPVKAGGVIHSQDAQRRRRPSTQSTRQGMDNAQGTAQGTLSGMVDNVEGIPRQLRWFNE